MRTTQADSDRTQNTSEQENSHSVASGHSVGEVHIEERMNHRAIKTDSNSPFFTISQNTNDVPGENEKEG